MHKYKFTLSIGYSTADQEDEFEYEEEPSEEKLDADWKDWAGNYIEGSWQKID